MRSRFRIKELIVALSLAVATATAADEKEPRVRAKDPTVVTVHGKQDQVSPEAARTAGSPKDRNVFEKAVHGVGRGFAAVGKGVYKLLDDAFGGDDVVPSSEERDSKRRREER